MFKPLTTIVYRKTLNTGVKTFILRSPKGLQRIQVNEPKKQYKI